MSRLRPLLVNVLFCKVSPLGPVTPFFPSLLWSSASAQAGRFFGDFLFGYRFFYFFFLAVELSRGHPFVGVVLFFPRSFSMYFFFPFFAPRFSPSPPAFFESLITSGPLFPRAPHLVEFLLRAGFTPLLLMLFFFRTLRTWAEFLRLALIDW